MNLLLHLKEKFTITLLNFSLKTLVLKTKGFLYAPQQKYEVDCLDWRGAFEKEK